MNTKIFVQTKVSPETAVYDNTTSETTSSGLPSSPGQSFNLGSWLLGWMKPVVRVEVEGRTIYQSASSYPDQSYLYIGIAAAILAVLIVLVIRGARS